MNDTAEKITDELAKREAFYFSLNLPLQMWPTEGGWRVLNYMPRKEAVNTLDTPVTEAELPRFCERTSKVLRNLADLFDALGRREIDVIYYPDETVAEAIADCKAERQSDPIV